MHETPLAHLHLDGHEPHSILRVNDRVLRGWVVAKPGGHFCALRGRVKDTLLTGLLGFPRRDLAEFFQACQSHLLAGFELPLSLSPGLHELQLEACDICGAWVEIENLIIEISPDSADLPVSQTSRLRAHELSSALRLLLRRLGDRPVAEALTMAREIVAATPRIRDLRFAHRPFHGHVDQPARWEKVVYGRLPVAGWLFHETLPIKRIFATTDLQAVQALKTGQPVPHLHGRFPEFLHSKDCGFEGVIDLPAQVPSPVHVTFYAELADGSWHLGPIVQASTVDHEEAKEDFGNYGWWRFRAVERSLGAALQEIGLPVESCDEHKKLRKELIHDLRQSTRKPTVTTRRYSVNPGRKSLNLRLFTHNLNHEGAPGFLWEYARALVGLPGMRLSVTSTRDGPLRSAFEQLSIPVSLLNVLEVNQARTPAAMARAICGLETQESLADTDLVVCNTLSTFWGIHLAQRLKIPSLFYIHESAPPAAFYDGHYPPAVIQLVENTLAIASRVSFLTTTTLRYYRNLSDGANYTINPGWIDVKSMDALQRSRSKELLRAKLGLASDRVLVCNVGTVCDRKGQHIFARSVDLLWRSHPELAARTEFLMVGGNTTSYDEGLADFLSDLGRSNLHIIPTTGDVHKYYGAADLFVSSSYEESFPRVILEAMAFGVPIVSSAVHGVPEIVRPELEAMLVPPGNSFALADAMARLLNSPKIGTTLAARARARVESCFAIEQVMPRHIAMTFEVAGRPDKP